MKIAIGGVGDPRPTDFTLKVGPTLDVIVFKREKAEKK